MYIFLYRYAHAHICRETSDANTFILLRMTQIKSVGSQFLEIIVILKMKWFNQILQISIANAHIFKEKEISDLQI